MNARTLFRLTLLCAGLLAGPAFAQADPPLVAGRVEALRGPVSVRLRGSEQWQQATINLPVTDGTALWTEPGSEVSVEAAGNRITLGASTELDVDHLDDHQLEATLPQGEAYLRLLHLPPGGAVTIRTPRGAVGLTSAGRYAIVAGDTEHPTAVTVLEGSAEVTGLPVPVSLAANQSVTVTGDGAGAPFAPVLGAPVQDEFLRRVLASERAAAPRRAALPAPVALMTGVEALDEYGEWGDSAEYGPVWYPPSPSYVPYRDGRWTYVQPWGWTWVDSAPWGFAPSHYGRWAEIGGRWAWLPGRDWAPDRPAVYAPALVGFIGGAALGARVGWVPLGPHDAYRPPYGGSPRYIEALNRPAGADPARPVVNIVNRQAVTVVPAAVMSRGAGVAAAARPAPPIPPGPLAFRAAVAPVPAIEQSAARPFAGRPPGMPAPGPAPARARPGGGLPPLRPTVVAHPGPGALPALRPRESAPAGSRPDPGLPAPTAPGAGVPGAAAPGAAARGAALPAGPAPIRPEPAAPVFRPGPAPAAPVARPHPVPPVAGPERPVPPAIPHERPPPRFAPELRREAPHAPAFQPPSRPSPQPPSRPMPAHGAPPGGNHGAPEHHGPPEGRR